MSILRAVTLVLAILSGSAGYAELPEGEAVMDKVTVVFREMRDLAADVEVHTADRQASGSIVLQYVRERSGKTDGSEKVVRKYIVETRVGLPEGLAVLKQVCDGGYLWTERKIVETGEVKVIRRKTTGEGPIPGGFGPDWRKEIDRWRRKYSFKTLRTDTVDGERVLVVEGVRRDSGEDPDAERYPELSVPGRIVLFVSSRDDFPRKVELFAAVPQARAAEGKGQPTVSVRLTNLRLNKGLDPETFHYTVPPGAEFIDAN